MTTKSMEGGDLSGIPSTSTADDAGHGEDLAGLMSYQLQVMSQLMAEQLRLLGAEDLGIAEFESVEAYPVQTQPVQAQPVQTQPVQAEPMPADPAQHSAPTRAETAISGPGSLGGAPQPAARVPLSTAQVHLLLTAEMVETGSAAYNEAMMLELRGDLDTSALERAFQQVVQRHEALRTSIDLAAQEQKVEPWLKAELPLVDFSAVAEEERACRLTGHVEAAVAQEFDLEQAPLVRLSLLRESPKVHRLLLVFHDLTFEGWSVGILLRELDMFYSAELRGEILQLEPPLQFRDYLAQREIYRGSPQKAASEAFWCELFSSELPALALPADRPRPLVPVHRGGRLSHRLPTSLRSGLQDLARGQGVTLFMVLQASFMAWIHRLAQQSQVVVAYSYSGRFFPGSEGIMGHGTHYVPLLSRLESGTSFVEFLASIRSQMLQTYEHQDYPFSWLIETLGQPGRSGEFPLAQVLMNLERTGIHPRFGALETRVLETPIRYATFDLHLNFTLLEEGEGGILLDLDYSADLYDEATVRRWLGWFQNLLTQLMESPNERVLDLSLLSASEMREMLAESEPRFRSAPLDLAYRDLFAEQVARTPDAVALSQGDREWSYGEIGARAQKVAWFLHQQQVGPEHVVPVVAQRGLEMAAALVGILGAGAAFLAVDIAWPAARVAAVLEACDAPLMLVDAAGAEKVKLGFETAGGTEPPRHDLGKILQRPVGSESATWPPTASQPESLAYVIFTSGSTGTPKGVMIHQRGLVNHLAMMIEELGLTAKDCIAQTAAVSFDIFVWQWLTPWWVGGRVHLVDTEAGREPETLLAALQHGRVSVFQTVPTLLGAMIDELEAGPGLEALATLRWLLPTGETLPKDLCRRWLDLGTDIPLVNAYGPAECSDDVTLHTIDRPLPDTLSSVPIGRPLGNLGVSLLDGHGRPVAPGLVGEICVSGVGVGRGYLHRPAQTAAAFVPDALGGEPGSRVYKSGDLGRRLAGGALEFLGRRDQQIKVRGVRIEIGEVEAALRAHEDIAEAVVIPHPGASGGLAAYVVWTPEATDQGTPAASSLPRFLRDRLPTAMVPTAIQGIETLPRTGSGKIDRRALPDIEQAAATLHAAEGPRTPGEALVSQVWEEVLGFGGVGIHSDFFDDAGGHSLMASKVMGRLRKRLGISLRLRQFFEGPTIAKLAALLPAESVDTWLGSDEGAATKVEEALSRGNSEAVEEEERLPMSDAQRQLVLQAAITRSGGASYNEAVLFRLVGPLHFDHLKEALQQVVHRHEALRSAFSPRSSQVVVKPRLELEVRRVSVASEQEIEALVDGQIGTPFDLETPPLFRFLAIEEAAGRNLLVFVYHLAAFEGWSVGVLLEEVEKIYGALVSRATLDLPDPLQYRDYLSWIEEYRVSQQARVDEEYWLGQFAGEVPVLDLPTDRPYPAVMPHRGARVSRTISAEFHQGLRGLAQKQGSTLFMVLYAAYMSLLHRLTGQQDVVVGFVVNGRTFQGSERIMGYCAHFLPVRSRGVGDATFEEFLATVRHSLLDAYEHQDYPFAWMVEKLDLTGGMDRFPLFMASFNMERAVAGFDLAGVRCDMVSAPVRYANYAVHLNVAPWGDTLELDLDYSADLFDAVTAERWLDYFLHFLEEIVAAPAKSLSEVSLQTAAERRQMMEVWNDTARDVPTDRCFFELFTAQVIQNPDTVAVCCGDREWTYEELHVRARRVASVLVEQGVGPDRVVALLADRSESFLLMILAILDAGGAWLPLDPLHPPARLQQILESSGSGHLVVERQYLERVAGGGAAPGDTSTPVVTLLEDLLDEAGRPASDAVPAAAHRHRLDPQNLAYVIYTSGSTGLPKGVMLNHVGMINHLFGKIEDLSLTDKDRVTQTASQCFDISVWQFLAPLLVGATVEVVESRVARDPVLQAARLEAGSTTVFETVPVLLHALIDAFGRGGFSPLTLRWLMVTGEALPPDLASRWLTHYPNIPLMNAYGPTECSDDVTHHVIDDTEALHRSTVPIGKALINTRLYVLDRAGRPTPAGVTGELCVGGAGVGRGYLGSPAQTAAVFVPDPWSQRGGERLYRTGDLTRFLWDGSVEFLGRLDHQVKVRGFRIELGEIEAALVEHPLVHQAAVVVRDGSRGAEASDPEIHGFVVPQLDLDSSGEREVDYVDRWRALYDTVYGTTSDDTEASFNTAGWTSSFTGEAISEQGMREFVDYTVEQILAPEPQRILELGCGSGMLLHRLAPRCVQYIGTDLSPTVIEQNRLEIERAGLENVHLLDQPADVFDNLPQAGMDCVVLNSVAQYFPNLEYFLRVVRGGLQTLAPGGRFFLGDLRSLPLLEVFHTSVLLARSAGEESCEHILGRARAEVLHDKELVIDPALFFHLGEVWPEVAWVEIHLKRGREHTEMVRFRYNVVLGVRGSSDAEGGADALEPDLPASGEETLDWRRDEMSLEELARRLQRSDETIVRLGGIPNARIAQDVFAHGALLEGTAPATVAGLLTARPESEEGVDPEDLHQISAAQGWHCQLAWTTEAQELGDMEAVFSPRPLADYAAHTVEFAGRRDFRGAAGAPDPEVDWRRDELRRYATRPDEVQDESTLIKTLREHLQQSLPEYMVPSAMMVLPQLPVNASGKLDRKALPQARKVDDSGVTAPGTSTEARLAEIWQEVLGVSVVGVEANFFSLGGHSLLATQVLSRLGGEIPLSLIFERPVLADFAAEVDRLTGGAVPRHEHSPAAGDAVMTAGQRRRWRAARERPGSPIDILPGAMWFTGELDRSALDRALDQLLARHETLRTVFPEGPEGPTLEVREAASLQTLWVDLSAEEETVRQEAFRRLQLERARKVIELGSGPLLDTVLLKLGANDHVLMFYMSHLIADGWSVGSFIEDLQELYRAAASGTPNPLDALPITVGQASARQALSGVALEQELQFWRRRLGPDPPRLGGPFGRTAGERRAENTYVAFDVAPALTEALAGLSKDQNVTLYVTFLASIKLLLATLTGQDDVVVCSSFSGRRSAELNPLIGYFVKNLPLRAQLREGQTFLDLLCQIHGQVTETYDHQDMDPAELAEMLFPATDDPRRMVFSQVLFIYHNPPAAPLELPGTKISELELDTQVSDFDLTVHLTEEEGGFRGALETQPGVFPAGLLEWMATAMGHLLAAIAEAPEQPQSALTLAMPAFQGSLDESWDPHLLDNGPAEADSQPTARPASAPASERTSPLTSAQARFWLLSQLTEQSAVFNVPLAARLTGPLDVDALLYSFQQVADRHEILRTVFVEDYGEASQCVLPTLPLSMPTIDLEHLGTVRAEEALRELAASLAARPYDLEKGPLWHLDLARLGKDHHVLFVNLHHLVCDGWSIDLLLRELSELYGSRLSGRPARLPQLPMQYSDVALSQAGQADDETLRRKLQFWVEELEGLPRELTLPTDRPRRPDPTFAGGHCAVSIPSSTVHRLQALNGQGSTSAFIVLLAGFQVLLHRWSGAEDVFVGTAVAGRHQKEAESLIGFFANSLVLRVDLGGQPSFLDTLRRVRRSCLRAFDHQDVLFENVVAATHPTREVGQLPLFQVMFVLQSASRSTLHLQDVEVEPLEFDLETAGYDLVLDILEEEEEFRVTFEYSKDVFDGETIHDLAQRFVALLEAVDQDPQLPISQLNWEPTHLIKFIGSPN